MRIIESRKINEAKTVSVEFDKYIKHQRELIKQNFISPEGAYHNIVFMNGLAKSVYSTDEILDILKDWGYKMTINKYGNPVKN